MNLICDSGEKNPCKRATKACHKASFHARSMYFHRAVTKQNSSFCTLPLHTKWYEVHTCCRPPRLGPTAGSVHTGETATLVGPITLRKSLQIRNNTFSIAVTILGTQSHSKTSNWMECTILTHVQGYQFNTEHKCKPYQYSHIQSPPNY